MTIVWVFIGLVLGLYLASMSVWLAFTILGGVLGLLIARQIEMKNTIRKLSEAINKGVTDSQPEPAQQLAGKKPEIEAIAAKAIHEPRQTGTAERSDAKPLTPSTTATANLAKPAAPRVSKQNPIATTHSRPQSSSHQTRVTTPQGQEHALWRFAKHWLTTGNLPVKVGVIILFFAVAFILKYAAEQGLLNVPIEWRFVAIAVFAIGLWILGWRLRNSVRVYALSLQGGGIGMLYVTIFTALQMYLLISAPVAFALLIGVTLAAGIAAVLQDSRTLAILAITGGFLAPVLTSTGSGNHVALFSYYLLLNAAILGIAWFKAWRSLNLLGFVFTFIIGGLWGYKNYHQGLFSSTEPFLIAYFLFYQIIAVLFAVRQPTNLKGVIDTTLIFGTPAIAFLMQAFVVDHIENGLTITAATLVIGYTLAWLVTTRSDRNNTFSTLSRAYLVLAGAFAIVVIPLAFDDHSIALGWALQAAALVWIGSKQKHLLPKITGFGLLLAAGLIQLTYMRHQPDAQLFLNKIFIASFAISLSALFCAYRLGKDASSGTREVLSLTLLFWSVIWFVIAGSKDLTQFLPIAMERSALLAYFSAGCLVLTAIARYLKWHTGKLLSVVICLPLIYFASIFSFDTEPLAHWGWLIWPLAFLVQYFALKTIEPSLKQWRPWLHAITILSVIALAAWEWWWLAESYWNFNMADVIVPVLLAILCAAAILIWLARDSRRWPMAEHRDGYFGIACGLLSIVSLVTAFNLGFVSSARDGFSSYLPIINPTDVVLLVSIVVAFIWFRDYVVAKKDLTDSNIPIAIFIGVVVLVMTTTIVLRGVSFYAEIPWSSETLVKSVTVQAAVTVYWGLIGFSAMFLGASKSIRSLWVAGAVIMSVVVGKLFLVDLGNSGTVARIVSFVAVGGLLLIVGYFAPVPPRAQEAVGKE